jgi:hypothetical protein
VDFSSYLCCILLELPSKFPKAWLKGLHASCLVVSGFHLKVNRDVPAQRELATIGFLDIFQQLPEHPLGAFERIPSVTPTKIPNVPLGSRTTISFKPLCSRSHCVNLLAGSNGFKFTLASLSTLVLAPGPEFRFLYQAPLPFRETTSLLPLQHHITLLLPSLLSLLDLSAGYLRL